VKEYGCGDGGICIVEFCVDGGWNFVGEKRRIVHLRNKE